jgi:phospholipid/cholesterol/gamma-HCH transport system ATP-binding protein
LRLIIGLEDPDAGSIGIHGQEIVGLDLTGDESAEDQDGFPVSTCGALRLFDSGAECRVPSRAPCHDVESRAPRARHGNVEQRRHGTRSQQDDERYFREACRTGGPGARAGAAARNPALDEPTAGLDPITSGEIDDLVLKLHEERALTSIVVTHDLHSAKTIADRLVLLDKGKVVMEGSFAELAESDDEFVRDFLKRDS